VFGSPLFNKVILKFENGRELIIEAPGNTNQNIYVQNIRLNGKVLDRDYIKHSELTHGGKLVFEMGAKPDLKRGTRERAFPYSMSVEQ
jgi:putative alpha-1,2-mannosidase